MCIAPNLVPLSNHRRSSSIVVFVGATAGAPTAGGIVHSRALWRDGLATCMLASAALLPSSRGQPAGTSENSLSGRDRLDDRGTGLDGDRRDPLIKRCQLATVMHGQAK